MKPLLVPLISLAAVLLLGGCDGGQQGQGGSQHTVVVPVVASDGPQTAAGAAIPRIDCKLSSEIRDTSQWGPWANRLLLATSSDSVTWQRSNVILTNHADVPSVVVDSAGALRAYFVSFCEGVRNRIVRATTTDLSSWTMAAVTVAGLGSGWSDPVDPTVVLTDDGRFRLYFTAHAPGTPRPTTYSAISIDGLTFTLEPGARYTAEAEVLDPSVLRVDGGWVLFAGGGMAIGKRNYAGFSRDGLSFTPFDAPDIGTFVLANGVAVPGGYRYYAFGDPVPGQGKAIRSLFSKDGRTWQVEDGYRLAPDPANALESDGSKDPAVARLASGQYVMVYVSGIPGLVRPGNPPPPGSPPPR